MGLPQYRVVQQLWPGSTVKRVATVQLQHYTHQAPLQLPATQWHGATLLTVCSDVDDKTRRTHTLEDIIYYS
jgi:hypothetical protein